MEDDKINKLFECMILSFQFLKTDKRRKTRLGREVTLSKTKEYVSEPINLIMCVQNPGLWHLSLLFITSLYKHAIL